MDTFLYYLYLSAHFFTAGFIVVIAHFLNGWVWVPVGLLIASPFIKEGFGMLKELFEEEAN
jgi:zinc transporter ZupT